MNFSKNYYKYIIGVAFAFFALNINAREVCFDTPTYITTPYVGTCMPNEVCVSGRTVIIHQCVNVPDEYTGPVTPPGSSPAPSGSAPSPYNELDNTRPTPPVIPKPESCNANAIAVKLESCNLSAQNTFSSKTDNCVVAGASVFAISTAVGAGLAIVFRDSSLAPNSKVLLGGAAAGATVGGFLADYVYNACSGHYSANLGVDLAQCGLDEKLKIQECAHYD